MNSEISRDFDRFLETAATKSSCSGEEGDPSWINQALLAGGIGLFVVDVEAQTIYPSAGCCELFGLPARDSYSTTVFEELLVERDKNKASSDKSRKDGSAELNVEYRVARADTGEVRIIERRATTLSKNGKPVKFVGTVRDITAHRRADAEAERRAEKLREFSATRDFMLKLVTDQRSERNPEFIMLNTSKALRKWLKIDRVGFFRLINSDQTQYFGCSSQDPLPVLKGKSNSNLFGKRAQTARRDGQMLSFSDIRDEALEGLDEFADQGVFAGLCIPLQAKQNCGAGIYAHHSSPRNWSKSEIELIEEVSSITWNAVERAEALLRLTDRIGRQQDELTHTIGDVSRQKAEREAAESKLRQLEKMESVGMLTGGIAHDFNNMLSVILGALTLTKRKMARGQTDVTQHIDSAIDAAKRASALTARLLAFARQQPLAPQPLDANNLLAGMSELLTRSLGEQIQLETIQFAGLWPIMADQHQLENIIINLAVNARDAMPNGGRLTIETGNLIVSERYSKDSDLPDGHYTMIAVSDTGTGMSPEVISKAFDPFFTTKEVGKGSGLGLSQVYGFTSQSGGHVRVQSKQGQGTIFRIYLPRHWGELDFTKKKTEPKLEHLHGSADVTVMVVDDDERMRMISVEVLKDLGYDVVYASSGVEAINLLKKGRNIDLLFTDVVMPEMTGEKLADEALKIIPGLKVLFTSGYTHNSVVNNGILDADTHLLLKPFTVNDLSLKISIVLNESLNNMTKK